MRMAIALDELRPARLLIRRVRHETSTATPTSIVERARGWPRQTALRTSACEETVIASGELERLANSVARYASAPWSSPARDRQSGQQLYNTASASAHLLFGGCGRDRLPGRDRGTGRASVPSSPVRRAVFLSVLHRLMVSGSGSSLREVAGRPSPAWTDWRCTTSTAPWPGWAGTAILSNRPGRHPLRTVRTSQIEEQLFASRRDLFSELSGVLDTTSLSFTGAGGGPLEARLLRTTGPTDADDRRCGDRRRRSRPVCSEIMTIATAIPPAGPTDREQLPPIMASQCMCLRSPSPSAGSVLRPTAA
jgi:hypothetical protein